MAKGSKRNRSRDRESPSVERPRVQRVSGPAVDLAVAGHGGAHAPAPLVPPSPAPTRRLAAAVVGATKAKKTCCRSRPRCKRCPVVLMRAARLQESGLTGKDLAKAVKRARAA